MFEIVGKARLNESVSRMDIRAPFVTRKCEPGQFVIVRADVEGERIPLTIADFDRASGVITVIYQLVGAGTRRLDALAVGESPADVVGPLGMPSEVNGIQRACVVGGGVGCAIAWPTAKKLKALGARVEAIVGFRNKDLIILEDEFRAASDALFLMTDDGSAGRKGLVTDMLRERIEAGANYDRVIAIGPLIMMKFVSRVTKEYGIKTVVSMNPLMIDGTGMCGCCRLTVGGQTRFACVDGPEFDGHLVDFDEAMERAAMYRDFEKGENEHACNLLKGV